MNAIKMLQQTRVLLNRLIEDLSEGQLLLIPDGFRNNLLWNFGHLVVTQQLLNYKLAGQEMYIDQKLCDQLRKGTSPADWDHPPDLAHLKKLSLELPRRLEEDYRLKRFDNYGEYTTSTGITLHNINDAVDFNNYHEGVHAGIILYRKRLLV